MISIAGPTYTFWFLSESTETFSSNATNEISHLLGPTLFVLLGTCFVGQAFSNLFSACANAVIYCYMVDEEMYSREQTHAEQDLLDFMNIKVNDLVMEDPNKEKRKKRVINKKGFNEVITQEQYNMFLSPSTDRQSKNQVTTSSNKSEWLLDPNEFKPKSQGKTEDGSQGTEKEDDLEKHTKETQDLDQASSAKSAKVSQDKQRTPSSNHSQKPTYNFKNQLNINKYGLDIGTKLPFTNMDFIQKQKENDLKDKNKEEQKEEDIGEQDNIFDIDRILEEDKYD